MLKTLHVLCPKLHPKTQKHKISYNIKSKRANLVKHTFPPSSSASCLPTAKLGVCLLFTSLVCPGWLLRHLLLLCIHLPQWYLQLATSFSCCLAAQFPPLIVLRCRRFLRHRRLLSAGASGWLS